jgi:hypothetical protein
MVADFRDMNIMKDQLSAERYKNNFTLAEEINNFSLGGNGKMLSRTTIGSARHMRHKAGLPDIY